MTVHGSVHYYTLNDKPTSSFSGPLSHYQASTVELSLVVISVTRLISCAPTEGGQAG